MILALAMLSFSLILNGKDITIPSGDTTIKAYLAVPEGKEKHPGIIVVQEWWGLNEQIKTVADRLAKEGFVAIVPDLYRGKVGTDEESAHELMRGLPDERALGDIKAAADFLEKHESVASKDLGILGFCMGGRYALLAAIDDARIKAMAMCYGRPETNPEKLKKLSATVLGIFGGTDNGIGSEQIEAFKKALKEAGKTNDIQVYDGAGHAFMNEKAKGYKEKAAADAWVKILAFFKKNLPQK